MRKFLVTAAAVLAMILMALWLEVQDESAPLAAPPATESAAKPSERAQNKRGPTTPPLVENKTNDEPEDESHADWREIIARHEAHPEGSEEWKQQGVTKLTNYYSKVNDALAADETHERYIPVLKHIDCRDKSCVMELEFRGFAQAMAYFEMVQTARMKYDYGVSLNFDCPPKRTALPRTPGQPYPVPFRTLFQLECDDDASAQTNDGESVLQ